MTRQRRALLTLAVLALGVGAVLGVQQVVSPQAIDACIVVYEDLAGGGDSTAFCNTPANLKDPDLSNNTAGLHGGCNRGVNQSSSWTDCISSVRINNLPAAYRAVLYQSVNYTSNRVFCTDINGTTGPWTLSGANNDVASSLRLEGGNC